MMTAGVFYVLLLLLLFIIIVAITTHLRVLASSILRFRDHPQGRVSILWIYWCVYRETQKHVSILWIY
jgi:hypothetical protein